MSIKQSLSIFDAYLQKAGLDSKPHQREGLTWALQREFDTAPPNDVHGGIIADEMGLGKTILMMGLIVSNFVERTLIVLPLALLEQWENEIYRTMGHKALVWHGNVKKHLDHTELERAPIVITTYGQISDKTGSSVLHKINWNRVIFDEAHHLRNHYTNIHRGAVAIKATNRWLITGTPIQNRVQDFYALCAAMGMKEDFYTKQENLNIIGSTFLLKRTKQDVGIELPPLHIHEVVVPWSNEAECKLATDIHSMLRFSNVSTNQADNVIASLDQGMLATLVRARQTCVYPALIKSQIQNFVESGLLEDSSVFDKATSFSSKLDAVQRTVAERKYNNRSKIIFCHYRGEIDELTRRFTEEENMSVYTLDGRTSNKKRAEILTSKPDILILQIQTGCEGLNLQQFSEIYFVSPHWNPAIEDQAIARAHRIGQTSRVDIYRFVMEGFEQNEDGEDTKTLDLYSQHVQNVKRKAMKFVDGDIGEKENDEDELKNIDKKYKTKEGYLRDDFVTD